MNASLLRRGLNYFLFILIPASIILLLFSQIVIYLTCLPAKLQLVNNLISSGHTNSYIYVPYVIFNLLYDLKSLAAGFLGELFGLQVQTR